MSLTPCSRPRSAGTEAKAAAGWPSTVGVAGPASRRRRHPPPFSWALHPRARWQLRRPGGGPGSRTRAGGGAPRKAAGGGGALGPARRRWETVFCKLGPPGGAAAERARRRPQRCVHREPLRRHPREASVLGCPDGAGRGGVAHADQRTSNGSDGVGRLQCPGYGAASACQRAPAGLPMTHATAWNRPHSVPTAHPRAAPDTACGPSWQCRRAPRGPCRLHSLHPSAPCG